MSRRRASGGCAAVYGDWRLVATDAGRSDGRSGPALDATKSIKNACRERAAPPLASLLSRLLAFACLLAFASVLHR